MSIDFPGTSLSDERLPLALTKLREIKGATEVSQPQFYIPLRLYLVLTLEVLGAFGDEESGDFPESWRANLI